MNVELRSDNETGNQVSAAPPAPRLAPANRLLSGEGRADATEKAKMDIEKAKYYKTAKAKVSCAHFGAGEYVSVCEPWSGDNGVLWFTIIRSERGPIPYAVCYPEHHLSDFCL